MDIDIDLSTKIPIEEVFPKTINASIVENDELKKHPVGIYFQNIPIDPKTGYSAIPHKDAIDFGFYKIDMLHVNILNKFESKDEIKALLKRPVNWKLLEDREVVNKLFHLSKWFEVVYQVKPTSVLEIADILALIRPNKLSLLNKYLRNKKDARKELYTKRNPSDLRKSHAVAYALLIILQLHLIELGIDI